MTAKFRFLPIVAAAIALAWLTSGQANAAAPHARTETGTVRGVDAGVVDIYRGIPFALPPAGALRWAPPQLANHWSGARDASENGPACPQRMNPDGSPNGGGASGAISEDCLYLNVFAPSHAHKAPVMVWLHGGANTQGSGAIYDMKPFARDGVIVVAINYRLGAFGFFAHPALTRQANRDEPLGNYALMDQLAGLRWTKRNIAAFGGDPNNITVFGESAGAMDILALLALPSAKGLFNRAILESNIGWGDAASLAEREQAGLQLATRLGVAGANASVDALRAIPMAALVNAPAGARSIVDGRMVTEATGEAWDKGHILDVPLIVGANSYEASLFRAQQPRADMLTNEEGVAPARWIARQQSGGAPAWLYFFSYVRDSERARAIGAAHGSEIAFAHDTLARPNLAPPPAGDQAVATLMHSCGVAFAKTGKPDCASGPAWPAYDPRTDQLYEFGDWPSVRTNFRRAELDAAEAAHNQPASRRGRGR